MNRWIGSDDASILFACGVCGVASRYPGEMTYRSDRVFMCFRHSDTTTNLDEARKQGQGVRGGEEIAPRFPVGAAPSYFTSGGGEEEGG